VLARGTGSDLHLVTVYAGRSGRVRGVDPAAGVVLKTGAFVDTRAEIRLFSGFCRAAGRCGGSFAREPPVPERAGGVP